MIAVEMSVFFLTGRLTTRIVVFTRSRRPGAIGIPAPPVTALPPPIHTHIIHFIHLIRVIAEAGHRHRANECLHPHRPNGIEEVIHHPSWAARCL